MIDQIASSLGWQPCTSLEQAPPSPSQCQSDTHAAQPDRRTAPQTVVVGWELEEGAEAKGEASAERMDPSRMNPNRTTLNSLSSQAPPSIHGKCPGAISDATVSQEAVNVPGFVGEELALSFLDRLRGSVVHRLAG